MFRIKTDIRQYKCETKDKVEKLIRNWVIRPNDLIYDSDGKEWAPIGEHPAFVSLFGILDDQEKNTPDTVVTARSPYEGRGNGKAPAEEPAEEVTMMVGRPAVSDSEAEDVRATDVFDQDEIADSLSATDPPKPPEAPDGVEPPANDGEVTMMTERTLEMLKITDEDDVAKAPSGPSNKVVVDLDDEELAALADDGEEDEEITGVRERKSSRDGAPDEEAAEDEDEEDEEALEEEEEESTNPKAKRPNGALESGPKLGRHDLPEELFATNEISSPEVQEQLKRLDELGEIDPSEPNAAKPDGEDAGESGDWPARLEEDSGVDEAWDVIAEDLRTTEELDAAAESELRAKSDPALADTDEVERDEEYDDGEWDEDTSEPQIVSAADFVSDGYRIPLPFPVRPTAEDIRLGMNQGRVSRAAKDKTYPQPQPKKLDELHRRYFDLSKKPPRDQTIFLAVAVVVVVALIAIGVASC